MPAIDDPLIDRFLDALWLEKGLSDNTRDAYRSDLALFNGWLNERGIELVNAGRELILDHLAWRLEQHYTEKGCAALRHIVTEKMPQGLFWSDKRSFKRMTLCNSGKAF